jgi:hypothetical protein
MPDSELWSIDENGDRRFSPEQLEEVFGRYLKPCRPALPLTESPLVKALGSRGCTVVEADNPFVFNCHLATALIKRRNPDIDWDMIVPDTVMDRLIVGTEESSAALISGFDPLVLQAFCWPRYLKASLHIGHIVQTRVIRQQPTLFVVTKLDARPFTDPVMFDPDFRVWLQSCNHVRLTAASVLRYAVNRPAMDAFLAANPGSGRALSTESGLPQSEENSDSPWQAESTTDNVMKPRTMRRGGRL